MISFSFNHNFYGVYGADEKRLQTVNVYNETGVIFKLVLGSCIRTVNGFTSYRRENVPQFFAPCERKMKENFKGKQTYYMYKKRAASYDDDVTKLYIHADVCKFKESKEEKKKQSEDSFEITKLVTLYDDKGQKFEFDVFLRSEATPEKIAREKAMQDVFDVLGYSESERNDYPARRTIRDILEKFNLKPKK